MVSTPSMSFAIKPDRRWPQALTYTLVGMRIVLSIILLGLLSPSDGPLRTRMPSQEPLVVNSGYLLITCGAFELVTVLVEVICYLVVSINPTWVFGVHVCSTCLWLAEVALFSAANGLSAYLIKSKNLVSNDALYLRGTAGSFIASLETFIVLSFLTSLAFTLLAAWVAFFRSHLVKAGKICPEKLQTTWSNNNYGQNALQYPYTPQELPSHFPPEIANEGLFLNGKVYKLIPDLYTPGSPPNLPTGVYDAQIGGDTSPVEMGTNTL